MSRYTGEARITLNGDRALAARYISEGRKYLGGLMVTHPQATAVRELTNPDGVHFRVGYFGGVPFIQITATSGGEQDIAIGLLQGYMIAPRTGASITAYDPNPYVIADPKPGNEAAWKSFFHTAPPTLTTTSHPTNAFEESIRVYAAAFSTATAAGNTFAPQARAAMSWNNRAEDLWLYWSNCNYVNTGSFGNAGNLYINGALVFGIGSYLPAYTSRRLIGIGAARTPKGLTVYGAAACHSAATGARIVIFRAALEPAAAEKKRLDAIKPGLHGYANSFVVSESPEQIAWHPIPANYSAYSAFVFNQSANECRGIYATTSGSTAAVSEVVFDLRAYIESGGVDAVAVSEIPVGSGSGTRSSEKLYDSTTFDGRLGVPALTLGWDPYTLPNITATYTYTKDSAPVVEYDWRTVNSARLSSSMDLYNGYTLETSDTFTIGWFRMFVDFIDDFPVYGYIKPLTKSRYEVSTYTDPPAASETADGTIVIQTYPGSGVPDVVLTNASYTNSYERAAHASSYSVDREDEVFCLRCDRYDEDGVFVGFWADIRHTTVEKRRVARSGAMQSTLTKVTVGPGSDSRTVTYAESIEAPLADNYTTTKSVAVHHINLRTRSLAYTVTASKAASGNSFNCSGSGSATFPDMVIIPSLEITQTLNETKRSTVVMHDGATVFASPETVSATSSTGPSSTSSAAYFSPGDTEQHVSASGTMPNYNLSNPSDWPGYDSYITGSVQSSGPTYAPAHGVVALKPGDAVSSSAIGPFGSVIAPSVSAWPGLPGAPASSEGMATRKSSYLVNGSYYSGINARSPIYLASNHPIGTRGTVDYMTGAHGSPFFTAPFNLSAILATSRKFQK